MSKRKYGFIIFVVMALVLILSACGSSSGNSNVAYDQDALGVVSTEMNIMENVVATSSQVSSTEIEVSTGTAQPVQQKLIYKGDISINTGLYDDTVVSLLRALEEAEGYIVSQEDTDADYGRYTRIQVKIPSDRFFSWVESVEQLPELTLSKHIYTEDVSEEYVDLVARLESKQLVIDKYMEYMKLATTADELIRYTNELAALQEEIESFEARIRYLNHQVSYSTLTINIKEDTEHSYFGEMRIGSKIERSFANGVSGFVSVVAFIISAFIMLLPFMLIGLLIWFIINRVNRGMRRAKGFNHTPGEPPIYPSYQMEKSANSMNDAPPVANQEKDDSKKD